MTDATEIYYHKQHNNNFDVKLLGYNNGISSAKNSFIKTQTFTSGTRLKLE